MSKIYKPMAACAVIIAGLTWGGEPATVATGQWSAPAHAVIGRPLTPVSVAGVARRTTRRAVVYGAAVQPPPPPQTTVVVVESSSSATAVSQSGN